MAIFENQSLLNIVLSTGYDISAASVAKILYKKPDGTEGEWEGVVSDTTKISYDVQDGDLDQVGTWTIQSYVEIDSKKGYGAYAYMTITSNLD